MTIRAKTNAMGYKYSLLKTRHRLLDDAIAVESARPMPDFLAIQRLKRRKLKIKDELALIEGVLQTVARPLLPGAA